MRPIITLTTDFGTMDEYVGAMKGVILSRAPGAGIVDITHHIAPRNVRQAAWLIPSACRYFPAGTIHLVVVDPGVGTSRRLVLLATANHLYLAPDNGVLSLVLATEGVTAAYEITCSHLFQDPVSPTFHGRDILAPVAAALARGLRTEEVGPPLAPGELTRLALPAVKGAPEQGEISGVVVLIDHFGNLMTNIHRQDLVRLAGPDFSRIVVSVKDHRINGLAEAYAHGKSGGPLAIIGSRDYLEIAISNGSAARQLDLSLNDIVRITHSL